MYFLARWYDPALGRFTSADTIVPDLGNPQDWDRYAYSANNPVRYVDPSGHDYYDPGCDCMVHTGKDDKHFSNYDPGPYCAPFCGQPDTSGLPDDQVGELDPVAKLILSILSEPIDWLMTYGECQTQECGFGTWALTILPGAWGLFGKKADDLMTLYRAVSPAELDDLRSIGYFRPHPGKQSYTGKFFTDSLGAAINWGENLFKETGYVVVGFEVSVDVVKQLDLYKNLDTFGDAYYAEGKMLAKLNKTIQSIWIAVGLGGK